MLVLFFSFMLQDVRAEGGTAEAALNINTPSARNLGTGAQLAELARIDVTAVNSPLYLQGIQLGTDVSGGLSNFIEIIVYNQTNNAVIGSYHSSDGQDTFQFSTIVISNPPTKTFVIRGTPSSSASGIVRVGFKNLIFGETTTQINVPIYGNAVTLPGIMPTPTPSTSSGPTPTATATPPPTVGPSPTPYGSVPPGPAATAFEEFSLQKVPVILAKLSCYTVQLGLVAVGIALLYSGIIFLISHGSPEGYGNAKKVLKYALIGGFIIYGVYTIILSITDFFGVVDLSWIPLTCS